MQNHQSVSPVASETGADINALLHRLMAETRALGNALNEEHANSASDSSRAVLALHSLKERYRVEVEPVLTALEKSGEPKQRTPQNEGPALPVFAPYGTKAACKPAAADPSMAFCTTSVDSINGFGSSSMSAPHGLPHHMCVQASTGPTGPVNE